MAEFVQEDIIYREGRPEDVQHLFEICYGLGWSMSYDILESMFLSSPQSFIVAEHNSEGIGHCMGEILNEDEAFVSIFIVAEKYQKRGIGGALFRRCLEALGDRNVTLYANPEVAPYYKKHFGFKPTTEKPRKANLGMFKLNETKISSIGAELQDPSFKLVPLNEIPLESLEEYDNKIHVVNRRSHLRRFMHLDLAVAAVSRNQIVGYGCLRVPSAAGKYILGPVLADNTEYAKAIIKELLKKLRKVNTEATVMMLYFEDNNSACDLADKLGANKTVHFETLFTKHAVNVEMEKVYCMENTVNAFA